MPTTPTELLLRLPNGKPFVPLPGQQAFFRSPAKYRAIIAGLGYSKSTTATMELLLTALLYPGAQCAMVRWDFSALRGSTWKTMLDIIEASGLSSFIKPNGQTNSPQGAHVEFTNGSVIRARHGKRWEQFGSFQFDAAFLEECHEVPTSECWDSLSQRLRGHVGPLRLWMTGLSDGRNWVWERFVKEQHPNHELFRGASRHNPFLPPTYADEQYATLGRDRALLLLEGSFDAVEGRCLEMFDPKIHCLPRRSLPREWPVYCGVDPGFDDPAAMVKAVVSPNGSIIVTDFYEESGKITEVWAREMLARCQNPKPNWWVIDPSADRNTHLSPVSVLQTARAAGMNPLRTGNNDVAQSVARLRSLLTPDPNHCHPFTGAKPAPRLYFMEETCARLIWELQNLRWVRQGAASAAANPKLNDRDAKGVDCFVAGTLITTVSGEVPIEAIRAGDLVWTRDGLRPVVAAWLTGEREVMTVQFSNGRSLTGTPNHPIWSVEEERFVPLTSLRSSAIMQGWSPQEPSLLSKSGTGETGITATRTPPIVATGTITGAIETAGTPVFIAWCTKIITALFPRATKSTTGTATPSTTTPTTSKPFPPASTSSDTPAGRRSAPSASTSIGYAPAPLPGTAARTGGPGTARQAGSPGRDDSPTSASASSAGSSIPPSPPTETSGSAPTTAKPPTAASPASMTSSGSVPSAAGPSPATSTCRPAAAVAPAASSSSSGRAMSGNSEPVPPAVNRSSPEPTARRNSAAAVAVLGSCAAGTQPVYNLQVAGTPEYYANGLLVHNCLRYLVMEHLTPASAAAPLSMSDFWQQVLNDPLDARPYIEQIGGKPRGK